MSLKGFFQLFFLGKKQKQQQKKEKKKPHHCSSDWHLIFGDLPSFCFDKCTVVQCSDVTLWLKMSTCLRFMCFDWCFPSQVDCKVQAPRIGKKIIIIIIKQSKNRKLWILVVYWFMYFFLKYTVHCLKCIVEYYFVQVDHFFQSEERTNLFFVFFKGI